MNLKMLIYIQNHFVSDLLLKKKCVNYLKTFASIKNKFTVEVTFAVAYLESN